MSRSRWRLAIKSPVTLSPCCRPTRVTATDKGGWRRGFQRPRWIAASSCASCSPSWCRKVEVSSIGAKARSRSKRCSRPTKRIRIDRPLAWKPSLRRRIAALASNLNSTERAPSKLRSSGPSTCEWPIEPRWVMRSGTSWPRSCNQKRSPSRLPQAARRCSRVAPQSCCTVWMPAWMRRCSIDGPMPQKSRNSSACSLCGRSSISSTVRPSGFCMSEAVLARNRLGAMPMEQRIQSNSFAIRCLIRSAMAMALSRWRSRPIR